MTALKAIYTVVLALLLGTAIAEEAPASWDGLVEVKPKKMDLVYLLPGADFRPYTKVMVDPTEVAFRKDWLKDMNRVQRLVVATRDRRGRREDPRGGSLELRRHLPGSVHQGGLCSRRDAGAGRVACLDRSAEPVPECTGHDVCGPLAHLYRECRRSDPGDRSAGLDDRRTARSGRRPARNQGSGWHADGDQRVESFGFPACSSSNGRPRPPRASTS